MTADAARVLQTVGAISFAIALLQFVMYVGGREMYFACGTPDWLIRFRERRPGSAFVAEVGLALIFMTFAVYAVSASGEISPMPFLPYGVGVTAVIYLVRGMLLIPQSFGRCIYTIANRDRIYSAAAFAIGVAFATVAYRHWPELVQKVSGQ